MRRQPGKQMTHERMRSMCLRVINRPRNLRLTELIVPKPERRLRELTRLRCVSAERLCHNSSVSKRANNLLNVSASRLNCSTELFSTNSNSAT